MTEAARRERTARILGARLSELGTTALPRDAAAAYIEAAWVATAHAVALGFLAAEQAEALWQEAAARSPAVEALLARPLPQAA
ncbi:MAG TPA: hypothetical protein VGF23_15985 [Gaiellaceae bacterium]